LKRDVGAFGECGSYYPPLTYADELWDHDYLEACQELDREFPEACLLPKGTLSIGLSPKMMDLARRRMEEEAIDEKLTGRF
jgi:hypothetical protein